MPMMSMDVIRAMSEEELESKIQEIRSELTRLRLKASKKMLKKETGKLRPMRRNVARMMTRLNEMRRQ